MHVVNEHRFERTDIWKEGTWLDLWSVVHLLTGVSIGIGMPVFHFPTSYTFLMVLLSLVAYELWEAMVKIEETPQNRVMDVAVGMLSFVPLYAVTYSMPFLSRLSLFVPILAFNILLAFLGWHASAKADVFEKQLRIKLQKRRERQILKRQRRAAAKAIQYRRKAAEQLTKAPQEVS
ncbi:MAG TPA: hypothetical protein VGP13_02860 [Candidatus Paceibacterota bacterium]|jgi:hypothetical protein|nr:hypothetical protein [Candidatus Paceibacterota bacterium]